MRNLFSFLIRSRKREECDALAITGCIPLSFGVMFRCEVLCDTEIVAGKTLTLVNGEKRCETTCINVEKDNVVSTKKVPCKVGDVVCIVVEYTDVLRKFPLKDTHIVIG